MRYPYLICINQDMRKLYPLEVFWYNNNWSYMFLYMRDVAFYQTAYKNLKQLYGLFTIDHYSLPFDNFDRRKFTFKYPQFLMLHSKSAPFALLCNAPFSVVNHMYLQV